MSDVERTNVEKRILHLDMPIPVELAELADRVAAAKGVETGKMLEIMVAFWAGRVLGRIFRELQNDEDSRN